MFCSDFQFKAKWKLFISIDVMGLFRIAIPMTERFVFDVDYFGLEMAKRYADIKANTRCEQINSKVIEFDEQMRVRLTLQKGT